MRNISNSLHKTKLNDWLIMLVLAIILFPTNVFADHFKILGMNEGMPSSTVRAITQDKYGFIWFGTYSGLCRYDGHNFSVSKNITEDPTSIIANKVYSLSATEYGIWVGTEKGLDFYSYTSNRFNHCYYISDDLKTRSSLGNITNIVRQGHNLYITNNKGELFCHKKGFVFKKMNLNVPRSIGWFGLLPYKNNLLLAQASDGVYVLNPSTGKIISRFERKISSQGCNLFYDKKSHLLYIGFGLGFKTKVYHLTENDQIEEVEMQVPSNVNSIISYKGLLLFATDGQGMMYQRGKQWQSFNKENSELMSNVICYFLIDKENNLWSGTHLGGAALYSESSNWFDCPSVANGKLTNDLVQAVYADKDNIYIGTDGGGLIIYNKKTKQSRAMTKQSSGLPDNYVLSLLKDGNNLWMSIYGYGLCKLSLKDNSIKIIDQLGNGLSTNHILQIKDDCQGRIWCIGEIITIFDKSKNVLTTLDCMRGVSANSVSIDGDVAWISTDNQGLYKIRIRDYKLLAHYSVSSPRVKLSTNLLNHVFVDSKHRIWFSAAYLGALFMLDEKSGVIKSFGIKEGLTDSQITSIEEDKDGNLWMGSSNGLLKYSPHAQVFIRFGVEENLSSFGYFNNSSFYKDGWMYFGSAKGLVTFIPDKIKYNSLLKPIFVTSIELINKSDTHIEIPFDGQKEVKLSYADRFFSIHFTTPELITGSKILFKCYLEGLDKTWREIPYGREVSYTNVPPGEYNFYISATNNEGRWTSPVRGVHIIISPPWYRTTIAWMVWIALFCAALYLVLHFVRHEMEMKQMVRMKEMEKDTARRINEAKLNFFTNITHELRTPIFLITAPLEELLNSSTSTIKIPKSYITAIYRNAQRLSKLISRIIDFRKLESGKLKLELQNQNVVSFCKDLTVDYEALCAQKDIVFIFQPERLIIQLDFDPEKLESVISNLVANAFKYTPDGGKITFSVTEFDKYVEFIIQDNGIGIDKQYHEAIFDNFFQINPLQTSYAGDGIGLSFVKRLIRLHQGTIRLESELGKGSKFIFTIPKQDSEPVAAPVLPVPEKIEQTSTTNSNKNVAQTPTAGHTILLIDDEKEMINLMERAFVNDFRILKASNGQDGFNILKEQYPDLVVCDLMMPKMTGIEFLKAMRQDKKMAHIPVIVFTAKTSEEDMLEAFENGANAYLTKPISLKLLRNRIDSLLNQADSEETSGLLSKNEGKNYNKEEQKFLLHCKEVIDSNLTNPDFNLMTFATELGMSHSSLYKKIKKVTGLSAIEFVNEYRIFKAIRFMNEGETNISTISIRCGFNDIRTFREAFKKEMKVTPRDYLQQL